MSIPSGTSDALLKHAEHNIDLRVLQHVSNDDHVRRLKRFRETVAAVNEIVNKKLYRIRNSTLESYFRDTWKMSRAQVYRLLDCAIVLQQLDGFADLPSRERLCRSLKKLPKTRSEMRKLWKQVLVCTPAKDVRSTTIEAVWNDLLQSGEVTGRDSSDPVECIPTTAAYRSARIASGKLKSETDRKPDSSQAATHALASVEHSTANPSKRNTAEIVPHKDSALNLDTPKDHASEQKAQPAALFACEMPSKASLASDADKATGSTKTLSQRSRALMLPRLKALTIATDLTASHKQDDHQLSRLPTPTSPTANSSAGLIPRSGFNSDPSMYPSSSSIQTCWRWQHRSSNASFATFHPDADFEAVYDLSRILGALQSRGLVVRSIHSPNSSLPYSWEL
eukprot:jgi/Hompol1/1941/HPOL_001413-RA